MQWIHLGGLTLILSALLTWLLRHYALQRGLMDNPNARSSHLMATPRGGGLAFVLIYLGLLLWSTLFDPAQLQGIEPLAWVLLIGGGLVALIGFIDDHRDLSARLRFMVSSACCDLGCRIDRHACGLIRSLVDRRRVVAWDPVCAVAGLAVESLQLYGWHRWDCQPAGDQRALQRLLDPAPQSLRFR